MGRTPASKVLPRRMTRPELPGPRRRETPAYTSLTIDDLREKPGMLVGVADLVGIGVVPSYMALRRQRIAGLFPKPKTLPSRLLAWEARQITDWYDALPTADPVA
jgi:predicted DNA-binding transcriptional regulator AlpA